MAIGSGDINNHHARQKRVRGVLSFINQTTRSCGTSEPSSFWVGLCVIAIIGVLLFGLLDSYEGSKHQVKAQHSPSLQTNPSNRLQSKSDMTQVQELKPVNEGQHSTVSAPKATPVLEKDKVIDNLREASVTYDKAALPQITPDLTSPDPDVRQEAISAVVNIGDPVGAPFSRSQAAREADFNKKRNFLIWLIGWSCHPRHSFFPRKISQNTQTCVPFINKNHLTY